MRGIRLLDIGLLRLDRILGAGLGGVGLGGVSLNGGLGLDGAELGLVLAVALGVGETGADEEDEVNDAEDPEKRDVRISDFVRIK